MKWSYRAEYIRCGKGCSGCPHGPYWYGYRHEGGKMKKQYFGKDDPRVEVPPPRPPDAEPEPVKVHPWDGIFNRRTATTELAFAIMRIDKVLSYASALAQYRFMASVTHPDKGGSTVEFQRLEAAWSFLKVWHYYRK